MLKKFTKKGDLSINIIIIAVISLLVLVILMTVFSGKIGLFNDKTSKIVKHKCTVDNKGQTIPNAVITSVKESCPAGTAADYVGEFEDVQMGYKCCRPSMDTRMS